MVRRCALESSLKTMRNIVLARTGFALPAAAPICFSPAADFLAFNSPRRRTAACATLQQQPLVYIRMYCNLCPVPHGNWRGASQLKRCASSIGFAMVVSPPLKYRCFECARSPSPSIRLRSAFHSPSDPEWHKHGRANRMALHEASRAHETSIVPGHVNSAPEAGKVVASEHHCPSAAAAGMRPSDRPITQPPTSAPLFAAEAGRSPNERTDENESPPERRSIARSLAKTTRTAECASIYVKGQALAACQ